jgi:hypothetical protein
MIINKTLLIGIVAVLGAVLAGQLTLGSTGMGWQTPNSPSHVRHFPSDAALAKVLQGSLHRLGVDTQEVKVNVKNRVATLRGYAYDKHEKQAVIAVAQQTYGIQAVDTEHLDAVVQLPTVVVVGTPGAYEEPQRNLVAKR